MGILIHHVNKSFCVIDYKYTCYNVSTAQDAGEGQGRLTMREPPQICVSCTPPLVSSSGHRGPSDWGPGALPHAWLLRH